jgi:hypothetical protein
MFRIKRIQVGDDAVSMSVRGARKEFDLVGEGECIYIMSRHLAVTPRREIPNSLRSSEDTHCENSEVWSCLWGCRGGR